MAARRHLCLPRAQPAAIRVVAADAARGNRESRAAPRLGARHADSLGDVVRAAAPRRGYAGGPGARARPSHGRGGAALRYPGRVSTQAINRLRTVAHCKPDLFATIVPATPDDSTCVVLTGNPRA